MCVIRSGCTFLMKGESSGQNSFSSSSLGANSLARDARSESSSVATSFGDFSSAVASGSPSS